MSRRFSVVSRHRALSGVALLIGVLMSISGFGHESSAHAFGGNVREVAQHQTPRSGSLITVKSTPAPSTPGSPIGVKATAGNALVTITWRSPWSNGGSPITGYTVTASPGGATASVGGGTTTGTVTRLANGTPYTFRVTAMNVAGMGLPSAPSNAVRPVSISQGVTSRALSSASPQVASGAGSI